jgi:hypothetical protein
MYIQYFVLAVNTRMKRQHPSHMGTWRHGDTETQRRGDMEKSSGKRKTSRFSLIRLPFAHRAKGSLLFVRLLTKKQTEVIRLQTD